MRISTRYQYDLYNRNVSAAETRLTDAQEKITTGRRVNAPSDDPSGMGSILRLSDVKQATTQYQANVTAAKGVLGYTDSTLSDVSDLLNQAYQLGVSGATDTVTDSQRAAMASQIGDMQKRLVDLANTQGPNGQYLFAGQSTDKAPFEVSNGALTYSGDNGDITMETGPINTMVVNTQGSPLFTDAYKHLEELKNNLLSGSPATISQNGIPDVQASLTAVTDARGQAGAHLQELASLDSQHSRRINELTQSISDVQDVDLSQAITDYQMASTAYQAALSVTSHGFGLSLMDFIGGQTTA